MSVVLSMEDVGPCRKQLKVEVPAPAVEAETERVVAEYRRQAKLPGFRKGKVPAQVVRKRFREDIEREVVDRLLPRYWRQAEAEKQLDPLLPPDVDDVDLQPGAALTFTASVETRPEIELGDIESFDLPELDTKPTAEEIDNALADLRRDVAELVPVERAASQGDVVFGRLIELGEERAEDGDPAGRPVSFELGDAKIWEELSLAATGQAAGREVELERREGEGAEAVTRRYRLAIESVRERDLPPLDDTLAAKVGGGESLDQLKERIGERIRGAKEQELRRRRETALAEQLRERHPLELPKGVVQHEVEHMLKEYAENLAGRGVDVEGGGIDWQRLGDQVRPQAEGRVHVRLLVDAVAEKLGVAIEESEFETALAGLARAEKTTTVALRAAMDRAGRLAEFRTQLRREKTLRRLMGVESARETTEPESPTATSDTD